VKLHKMILVLVLAFCLGCGLMNFGEEEQPTQGGQKVSENRCGDDVCDGPENAQNCPEDCGDGIVVIERDEEKPVEKVEGGTKQFRIVMTINAESNLAGIAGSDEQSYYEPVMIGLAEIEASFPADGGSAIFQSGMITLTDYQGKGPNCSVEVEEGMIGSTSDFTFSDIQWDPSGRMTFAADVSYDGEAYNTMWTCPPKPEVSIEEFPMYKLVGIFNEQMRSLSVMTDQGFSVREMLWGPNEIFQSTVDIVIEEIN